MKRSVPEVVCRIDICPFSGQINYKIRQPKRGSDGERSRTSWVRNLKQRRILINELFNLFGIPGAQLPEKDLAVTCILCRRTKYKKRQGSEPCASDNLSK